MFPCCEVLGWVDDIVRGFALELGCIVGASGDAESAADASLRVDDRCVVLFGYGVYLASGSARSAV